jgi:hypothetical protein
MAYPEKFSAGQQPEWLAEPAAEAGSPDETPITSQEGLPGSPLIHPVDQLPHVITWRIPGDGTVVSIVNNGYVIS